ncbi:MAG: 23S rRNA (adenine(2503)-C(2))-methyltransferase RlmN [Acholeplasmataceae bacterium]|nr:23S rRNA (adenine(2503)-C(2))-methyltransferase RlmN [Acholeplasmataceae bacterium]
MAGEIVDFFGLTLLELEAFLVENGFKPYNAGQIYDWVYQKKTRNIEKMSNLSKALRAFLPGKFFFAVPSVAEEHISGDGTTKYLLSLQDGNLIETVLLRHNYGNSLCVTSQVGCNMACTFCASGLKKRIRNLFASELVGQIIAVESHTGFKISHVVVMGTGEPFDNYENVIKFIKIINENKGLAIGQRHITVSTCGIVPMILRYADEPIRSNLAISLHAPNDKLRSRLMPINRKYPLPELIHACETYFAKTSRRVTYEYILLEDENDTDAHATELANLLKEQNCYVNLIPYNRVSEFDFKPTDIDRAMRFVDLLIKRRINVTLRKEQGSDIQAACGQLRLKNRS